jgi:uncharacterized protein involved in outer membrane biogenesis
MRTLRWSIVAVAVYMLLGFIVAPLIAKGRLTAILTRELSREVTIQKLTINPFALSVRVRGFLMKDRSGGDVAAQFDELYANLSAASLARMAPVLDQIRLVRPVIRIVRYPDNTYSYQDLLTPQPAGPPAPGPPPRFSLNNIEVVDGRIELEDRPTGKYHAVSDIQIGIPFLSSLPYATEINVEPSFSANVNGTPVALTGETKPFKDTRETTVHLALDGLDIARYADYSPVPLGIRVQRGTLDTRITLALTTRRSLLDSLAISGTAAIKALQVADNAGALLTAFDSLESAARFTLTRRGDVQEMVVSETSATLRGLRVPEASRGASLVEVAEIALSGVRADLGKHDATIDTLAIDQARLRVTRGRDGRFNFEHLTAPAASPSPGDGLPTGDRTSDEQASGIPWVITLKHLALTDAEARAEDHALATPAVLALTGFGVEADQLSTATDARGAVRLSAALNESGAVSVEGTLGLNPPNGEFAVTLKDIAIVPFRAYVEEYLNAVITRGNVSTQGRVMFSTRQPGAPNVGFRGDVSVRGFSSVDQPTDQDLLKWKSLKVSGVDFRSRPMKLRVNELALSDFYSRLIVNPDGTLNLQTLERREAALAKSEAADKPAPPPPPGTTSPGPVPDIRIGKITFARGNVNFSDYFVKPNFSANLTDLAGNVSEMTADTPGDVAIRGAIDQTAPLEIVGRLNALSPELFVDLSASARDIELSPLSPYSVKYAGYGIEKGKLSVRLKYFVEHQKLAAENNVYLDQLTFGERVESPTATTLPVLLAVSLLKDRNGVIDIDLPISGSLDDPEFSLGRIILKVIGNLIAKAATSPFALLSAAFGGGEELAFVDFEPGRAALTPEAERRLTTLATALNDRPGLTMEIAGRVNPDTDRDAYKRASIERKVKAQKFRALEKSGAEVTSLEAVVVAPDEYDQYLTAAYKAERFPKPRNFIGMATKLPVPEMEQLMFTYAQATDEDLLLLANARAQVVKEWLVENGGVSAERLFLTTPRVGDEALAEGQTAAPRAEFALK